MPLSMLSRSPAIPTPQLLQHAGRAFRRELREANREENRYEVRKGLNAERAATGCIPFPALPTPSSARALEPQPTSRQPVVARCPAPASARPLSRAPRHPRAAPPSLAERAQPFTMGYATPKPAWASWTAGATFLSLLCWGFGIASLFTYWEVAVRRCDRVTGWPLPAAAQRPRALLPSA